MKKNFAGAMILALGIGVLGAGTVIAAGSPDDMITTRQNEMKANMKAMKALVSILKGETAFDAAAVQSAAKSIQDARATSTAASAWDQSAQTGTAVKTGAKPEIWSDAAGFADAWKALDAAALKLAAVSDDAGLKAAFPALGGACKGCHEKFRAAE